MPTLLIPLIVLLLAGCGGDECGDGSVPNAHDAGVFDETKSCVARYVEGAIGVRPPSVKRVSGLFCEDKGHRRFRREGCTGICNGEGGYCAGIYKSCGQVIVPHDDDVALPHEFIHHILAVATNDGDARHVHAAWECQ